MNQYVPSRRSFLQFVAATSAAAGVSTAGAQETQEGQEGGIDADVPVAGDFPEGPTVGLERVAEGLPAPTDFQTVEVDGEEYHFVVTQTGQIFVRQPDGAEQAPDEAEAPEAEPEEETETGQPEEPEDGEEPAEDAGQDGAADQPGDGPFEGGTEFVFGGDSFAWMGREPGAIADEENPTLRLIAGETYTFTWENVDGAPHNVVIRDEAGEDLERTELVEEEGAQQSLEFEATEEMAEYLCEVHPITMVGDVQVVSGDEVEQLAQGEDEVAGEFVFLGISEGWVGQWPDEIDGVENPTLDLEPGETYRFTWTNSDGQAHNVVILDEGGNVLEQTEIISEDGAEQTLEFEATEEMAEYICEVHPSSMAGRIQTGEGTAAPEGMELFLDIEDRLVDLGIGRLGGYDERGLLSMALHPDFQENRTFYVRYSAPERHGLGYNHTDVLAEFEADEDLTSADPDSERTIMEVPQPQDNHNGGQLAFGPEGYLYTSLGDGGNVHDIGVGHVEDWYEDNEGGNAQDTSQNLLGGVHRIEVDPESDEEAQGPREGAYEVPDENPLADSEEFLGEYYAWGFRNPWGMSIDDDGTVFVADAGQHRIESLYVAEEGGNYSWNVKEGSFCFSPEEPLDSPEDCPDAVDGDVPDPRGGEELRDPIAEYRHRRISDAFVDSSVVVGGHRYQGEAISDLQGDFVFGNWSSQGVEIADGEVLVARDPQQDGGQETEDGEAQGDDQQADGAADQQWELEELQFAGTEDGSLNRYLYGVERDQSGELYLLTNTDYRPFPATGEIYRVVPEGEGEDVSAPEDPATIDAASEGDAGAGEDDQQAGNQTATDGPEQTGNETAGGGSEQGGNETVSGGAGNETAPGGSEQAGNETADQGGN